MTEGSVDRTDEILARTQERAFEVVTDEDLARFDEEELRRRHLEHCAEIAERLVPRAFRGDVDMPANVEETARRWFERFMSEEARDDEWNIKGRTGLCLVGRPGCGKTHVAWMLVRRVLGRGISDIDVRVVPELLEELREASRGKRSDRELLERLIDVDLLVLDDLGAKKLTEFREEEILQILDARSRNQSSTIVTTNIAAPSMSEYFGARNASRVGGMCEIVTFPNYDHRTGVDYSKGSKAAPDGQTELGVQG